MEKDPFIEYNNELKALKFAYKKLMSEINKELLKATRNFNSGGKKLLLLGRRHMELLLMCAEKGLADVVDIADSGTQVWGLSVYVSIEDPYRIEIIIGSENIEEGFLYVRSDTDQGLGKKPLINVQELINDLPDSMKLKRVE